MELVVVGFEGRHRASLVLSEMRQKEICLFDLDSAITVLFEKQGRLVVQQSIDLLSAQGSRWAELWGGFLEATVFQPFVERLSDAASGVCGRDIISSSKASEALARGNWWRSEVGIPDDFVRNVGALAQPGDSLIIATAENFLPEVAGRTVSKWQGSMIYTFFSDEQSKKIQGVLAVG